MASEAQRLIGISLTKIAQSRSHRGGASLHKNLLVATVLQKARYIFMEEAYNIVIYQNSKSITGVTLVSEKGQDDKEHKVKKKDQENVSTCVKCIQNQQQSSKIYESIDLVKCPNPLKNSTTNLSLKRRRGDRPADEVVQSILTKKRKHKEETSCTPDVDHKKNPNSDDSAMEIDRITSLVSIFSFSMGTEGISKVSRPTPPSDLCSSQAKDSADTLQQRSFLTMTV